MATNTQSAWRHRFGVWFRPVGRRQPWLLLGHCGTIEHATDVMYRAMGNGPSGDWCAGRLDRPPRPPRLRSASRAKT